MITDIKTKLNDLIEKSSFEEECHVVYYMVGIRKLLEHKEYLNNEEYNVLSFYLDWVVHTRLDRDNSLKRIEPVLSELEVGRGYLVMSKLCSMLELKNQLDSCLNTFGLINITEDPALWRSFRGNLQEVLSDQPVIVSSTLKSSVKSICYLGADGPDHISIEVNFTSESGKTRGVVYGKMI